MSAGGFDPYLPRLAREWLVDEPATKARELEGSLVFVDVSGFTQLSERLARLGREGAEQLADTINGCFSRLLAVAYGEGGSLLKFGGDALLLLFTGEGHPVRACRSAFGMRRTLRSIGQVETPAGRVVLRMSIGVHSGPIQCFLVGASHRELVVTGRTATTTVAMEAAAGAGEILVSRETAAALAPSLLGAERTEGILLRREPATLSPTAGDHRHPLSSAVAGAGVPLAVRTCLEDGPLEPEHRQATVAFIHFEGTDALIARSGPDAAVGPLEELVSDVQEASDHAGASFLTSDIDRDGGKLILAAGVPLSRGDDTQRMLTALDRIVRSPRALPIRVGVHHGDVFAGDIGPPYRRTYTVMGDAVNLAARLMAKAEPGQVVASDAVLERVQERVEAVALPPFTVKGKRRPVTAFAVAGARTTPATPDRAHPHQLVGRREELAHLEDALAEARAGRGRAVLIDGEAGVGKSRLLAELRARAADATQVDLSCQPLTDATPYAVFRRPLRTLLAIPSATSRVEAGQDLLAALERLAPELLPWASLLGAVIDADAPESSLVATLDERFRPERLRRSVVDLLDVLLPDATLLAVEDVHWIDPASAELLDAVCTRAIGRPWLVCLAGRIHDGAVSPSSDVEVLTLGPLPPGDAAALAEIVTGDSPLPPRTTDELVRRSGGNPLFLSELTAAAREAGGIDALPGSIEELIVARIDRLPAEPRRALRHLSALGQEFPITLAERVLTVTREVGILEREGFVAREGRRLRFVHSLIREAAYGSLPYRTRRRIHAAAGDAIAAAPGDGDRHADLLSFHYLHAHRFAEAWDHALVAADAARTAYAHAAAATFYERALAASRHLPDLDGAAVAATFESLGDARERMGSYTEAVQAYREARLRLAADPVPDARLMLKLARMQGWLRRYSQSLRWLTRGLSVVEPVGTPEAERQRAQLTAWYGHVLQEQGRHARAIVWCQRAAQVAAACGEDEALAHAYRTLDWAYVSLGQLDAARFSERALDLYQRLDDRTGQAHTLHNMASIAYLRGDWQEALQFNRRAEALYERTGNDVSVAFSRANIAEILLDQGRVAEAERLFEQVLRVSEAAGRRWLAAFARKNLGRIAGRAGHDDRAEQLLRTALATFEDMGARVELTETEARIAEVRLASGDAAAALSLADAAAARADGLDGIGMSLPVIHRTRGYALLLLGDTVAAREAFDAALKAARRREAPFEVALSLAALGDLHAAVGTTPPAEAITERDAVLDALGVTAIPRPPAFEPLATAVAG